jgi:hypothetical protein
MEPVLKAMEPILKAPGSGNYALEAELLSTFAFSFSLRRYTLAPCELLKRPGRGFIDNKH